MIKKLMWPGILFVLIGSVVVVDTTMLVIALNDDSFAVAEDYEGRGGTPSNSIDQARENRRLGWSVVADVRWVDAETVEVRLQVADGEGRSLDDPSAALQAFHKARAADVIEVPLVVQEDGTIRGTFKPERFGHWALRTTIVRGADVFTTSIDRVIDELTRGAAP